MRRLFQYATLAGIVAFLAVFLLLPIGTVLGVGCDGRLIAEVFRNQVYLEGLLNSLAVALVTTAAVFVVSVVLAMLYNRYEFPLKGATPLLMMLPMILPPFVGALGFQQLLGHFGVVNSLLGRFGLGPYDFLGGAGRFWSL